jgi:hypothetical protein
MSGRLCTLEGALSSIVNGSGSFLRESTSSLDESVDRCEKSLKTLEEQYNEAKDAQKKLQQEQQRVLDLSLQVEQKYAVEKRIVKERRHVQSENEEIKKKLVEKDKMLDEKERLVSDLKYQVEQMKVDHEKMLAHMREEFECKVVQMKDECDKMLFELKITRTEAGEAVYNQKKFEKEERRASNLESQLVKLKSEHLAASQAKESRERELSEQVEHLKAELEVERKVSSESKRQYQEVLLQIDYASDKDKPTSDDGATTISTPDKPDVFHQSTTDTDYDDECTETDDRVITDHFGFLPVAASRPRMDSNFSSDRESTAFSLVPEHSTTPPKLRVLSVVARSACPSERKIASM